MFNPNKKTLPGLTDESEIVESVPISVGTNENQIIGLPSDEINSEIAANENTNASMENGRTNPLI